MSRFVALLFVVAVAFAADPPKPKWPTDFSAGWEDLVRGEHGESRAGRIFWSETQKKERLDYVQGRRHIIDINIFEEGHQYRLEKTAGHDHQTCIINTIPKEMPRYDFSTYEYRGRRIFDGTPVDHWARKTAATEFTYYDHVNTEDPFAWERAKTGGMSEFTFFREVDRSRQDPTIFNVTYVFPDHIKCIRNGTAFAF
eukprot:TRINITY_DN19317_c0_g1_i1.p1 TRINITY_DN19317_c0_g1~~TRINITY_DN19317_c0_g1_i1.p1  ORF type:complete len:198 (+),score=44.25 TRINITY_DN19317_c0_g1_i1:35-628(+)